MKIEKFTLSNGIKCVVVNYPDSKIVSTNVMINAGGRYETQNTYGISHFLEHMTFKGTKKYPTSMEYSKKIESVGGIINAYTCEDHTAYWNTVPQGLEDLSFEMLAELVSTPLIRHKDMELERGVIIEEIRMAHDDPYIFMVQSLNKALWSGNSMESDVLGSEDNIKNITRKKIIDYMKKHYCSENIIISVAGNIKNASKIKSSLEKNFSQIKQGSAIKPIPYVNDQKNAKIYIFERDIKQSHAMIVYKTNGHQDKNRYAYQVLATILGRGMSSKMNEEIREKKGLAYTIRTETDTFTDTGYLAIYGGFNLKKTKNALDAIHNVIDKSKSELYEKEIASAKELLRGTLYYLLDSTDKTSVRVGKGLLLDPENIDPETTLKKIESVTAEQVRNAAKTLFATNNKTMLLLGPFKDKEKFVKILNR